MARERSARFSIAASEGLALSEFLDSAGVNHPETAPMRGALREVRTEPEAQPDNSPYLLIAAAAAILFGLFLLMRRS